MKNRNESPNILLDTEGGMFQMEIGDKVNDARELIEASTVSETIKNECRKILDELVVLAKEKKDKVDVADLCRSAVVKLLNLLDQTDSEQEQLFESVKMVILNARNSAKGWKLH